MITRAEAGTFKPNIFNLSASPIFTVPTTIKHAISDPAWFNAMKMEYGHLVANSTWTITDLPFSASVVGCKWKF